MDSDVEERQIESLIKKYSSFKRGKSNVKQWTFDMQSRSIF